MACVCGYDVNKAFQSSWNLFWSFAWFSRWDVPCYSRVGHHLSPHSGFAKGGGLQGRKGSVCVESGGAVCVVQTPHTDLMR